MEVETIAVIGAGVAGREIAAAAAAGGYRTILEDVSASTLAEGLTYVRRFLERSDAQGTSGAEPRQQTLVRLGTARSVEDACREADLVIDTTPEEMETKLEIFTLLDKFAKPGAIFASNAALVPISDIAGITFRAEKCVGMHFSGGVPGRKLMEIARAAGTSEDTVETCRSVGRRMGKEVVVVRESPGLLAQRVDAIVANEAFFMLEEGLAPAADIDRALRLVLNRPIGPLAQADQEGLDARLAVLEKLHVALGEKYRPSPLLRRYVSERRLGRKSGRGVYEYNAAAAGNSPAGVEKPGKD